MVDTQQAAGIPFALVLPAAGSGKRAGGSLPKPFQVIAGKTILEHTVHRFLPLTGLKQIIIAVSGTYLERVNLMFREVDIKVDIIEGGSERQETVYRALEHVDSSCRLVAIHDSVRPFVDPVHIRTCLNQAASTGAAVLGFPVRDTIKNVDKEGRVVSTPDRALMWMAQTPQVFHREIILEAYKTANEQGWIATDDAGLVERLKKPVWMVRGSDENFKITWPHDLKLARHLLSELY